MEIDQLAALRTTLDFHLLLTQSNPPARISLTPLWIAPPYTPQFEKSPTDIFNRILTKT
jgi:hypothetical protein